jgi:hypothetical protein
MTDQGRVNAIIQAAFTASALTTFTPGTGGGSVFYATPPYHLRLMTAQGSNTSGSNGTEMPTEYGYTVLGQTLGTTFCAAPSAGSMSNSNAVSWNATGTWPTITSIEIWDTAGTPLRWLQGALTSSITGVVNGDTVQFAAGSLTINASAW